MNFFVRFSIGLIIFVALGWTAFSGEDEPAEKTVQDLTSAAQSGDLQAFEDAYEEQKRKVGYGN